MRFVVDESADARLAAHLAQLGHDVTLIAQNYRPGLPDHEVLAIAYRCTGPWPPKLIRIRYTVVNSSEMVRSRD